MSRRPDEKQDLSRGGLRSEADQGRLFLLSRFRFSSRSRLNSASVSEPSALILWRRSLNRLDIASASSRCLRYSQKIPKPARAAKRITKNSTAAPGPPVFSSESRTESATPFTGYAGSPAPFSPIPFSAPAAFPSSAPFPAPAALSSPTVFPAPAVPPAPFTSPAPLASASPSAGFSPALPSFSRTPPSPAEASNAASPSLVIKYAEPIFRSL